MLDLLQSLEKLPITLEILQKTRIGMVVNKVRKATTDANVILTAKSLIREWKKLLGSKYWKAYGSLV